MYKKKKGFTLGEVIIYLGITSLILALPTSFILITERAYELKVESEVNAIHDFLMEAKQLSIKDNSYGEIIFDNLENILIYKNKIRYSFLKLEAVKVSNNMNNLITISDMGMINNAGTILITDKNNNQRKITITVGLGKINVK
ncbi:type IV pilin [Clostridium perfringens]|nr:type IV pilin [Clostridium perfringens]